MVETYEGILKDVLSEEHLRRLMALPNPALHAFVAESVELCRPAGVFVCTDAAEDIEYVRRATVERGEETPLRTEGHTIHFDGYNDQARDKANTKYLIPEGMNLGQNLNATDREQGLVEVKDFLRGIMEGKEVFLRFFCLGPLNSPFSISGVQITDSAYVAHSEDLLYRSGYEQFKKLGDSPGFFKVLHSSGRLENSVSADVDKRRIYIDIKDDCVYSVNTQYAGNTVGFKKLSLRLAIRKADREGWLAEHMFLMGVHGPGGRTTYFSGAFPSFCGKTSTAMAQGETIVGDDLAYLRVIDGEVYSANVESGIFGIIRNVTAEDDPEIYKVLSRPGEVIFSNVLNADGVPYWLGDGRETPEKGINFSGEWFPGKKDEKGNEIPCAHKNARYTIRLADLENLDSRAEDPAGVLLKGIIYGGRDSDTCVPVQQSFDWTHGVITMGAALESESTAATLGAEGVRSFQPFSNLDFVSIPLGRYIKNHLNFVESASRQPVIFGTNYFLKDADGSYLNGMKDKYVWLKWMERRIHGDVDVLRAPTGLMPRYEDLAELFREVLNTEYTREQYDVQFAVRVVENIAKIDRISEIYRTQVSDSPPELFETLEAQRKRLEEGRAAFGDSILPSKLETA